MYNLLEMYTTKHLFIQGLPQKTIKEFQKFINNNKLCLSYESINKYLNSTDYTVSTKKYYRNRLRRLVDLSEEL